MANDQIFTNDTNTKKAPRTDYSNLIHNGQKYTSLEVMVSQISRERAHVAFKSTRLILDELGSKATDKVVAEAMIKANTKMIMDFIKSKDDSRGLFGL